MPDNGSIQKRGAHEMAHGRPVQITEHTTVTELQPSLSDVVCANKKLQIGFIVALVVLALLSGFVARPHFADTKTWDSTIEVIDQKERKRTGAHDLVRGAVCGHYRAAG